MRKPDRDPDKKSLDGHVMYWDDEHVYYDVSGNRYKSATTFLKDYFPFDAEEVAKKVKDNPNSKFFGWTVREILDNWSQSATEGTELHNIVERYLICKAWSPKTAKADLGELSSLLSFSGRSFYFIPEIILYDEEMFLAGMTDIVEYYEGEDTVFIWDIKTSRVIDDKMEKFSMQLELYRRWALSHWKLFQLKWEGISEKTKFKVGGVVWFENWMENNWVKPVLVDAIDCKRDVAMMMVDRRNELK